MSTSSTPDEKAPPGDSAHETAPETAPEAAVDTAVDKPAARASKTPTQPEAAADDELDRVPLRGLSPISAPVDLTRTVPELIRRRSRGRFFGRKRLSDRLPFEWLSLAMLILIAAIYAALKLLSTN